jgi:CxxC motif-containing protein (DUF1111 family)
MRPFAVQYRHFILVPLGRREAIMQNASTTRFGSLTLGCLLFALHTVGGLASVAAEPEDGRSDSEMLSLGKQLFEHEWQPNDSRSHAGDGLGPLFNGRSCSSCHVLGGLGGAGPARKNVETLTFQSRSRRAPRPEGGDDTAEKQREIDVLAGVHPGLAAAPSVMLHLSSTDLEYALWRGRIADISGRAGRMSRGTIGVARGTLKERVDALEFESNLGVSLVISERNTTAIFGAGAIDSIPDAAIIAAAAAKHSEFPKVRGRVARLRDGRIGRFGWKAQIATLDDFTRAACAMEIGLEVPGHHQSPPIGATDYAAPGLDLSEHDVRSLVRFLRSLPAPEQARIEIAKPDVSIDRTVTVASLVDFLRDSNPSYRRAAARELGKRGEEAREAIAALHEAIGDRVPGVAEAVGRVLVGIDPLGGKRLFNAAGCATCHVPKLGDVEGIYSDLLLHDMGSGLADNAEYYRDTCSVGSASGQLASATPSTTSGGQPNGSNDSQPPSPREWRTPPLWGCAESAPYLHDGRATTLDQAIGAHDGEAAESRIRFTKLTAGEQLLLVAYLKTLGADENTIRVTKR